jgi:hypothetical protein
MLAASVNFAVVTVQSRPVFVLPFTSLEDMLAATPFSREREGKSALRVAGAAASGVSS